MADTCLSPPTKENKFRFNILEDLFHSKLTLYKDPPIKDIVGQEAILQQLIMKYLTNYGDYLAEQYSNWRKDAHRLALDKAE